MVPFLILALPIANHLVAVDGMKLRLEGRVQQRHLLTGTLGNLEEVSKKLTVLIHAINLVDCCNSFCACYNKSLLQISTLS